MAKKGLELKEIEVEKAPGGELDDKQLEKVSGGGAQKPPPRKKNSPRCDEESCPLPESR